MSTSAAPQTSQPVDPKLPICHDCKQNIPNYEPVSILGRRGFEKPEHEVDSKGKIKRHTETSEPNHEGKVTVSAVSKAVCGPCYLKGYALAHPGEPLPKLRLDIGE